MSNLFKYGIINCSVVPGYVDDSNEMICPGFKKFNIFFKVILMKLKSGTLFFFNGVGKHKIISLTLAISLKSVNISPKKVFFL